MRHPLVVYGEGLTMSSSSDGDHDEVMLRLSDGTVVPLAVARWLGPADETDERLLSAIAGPVLDVGCGPGRHLHALAKRGVFALGVDLSPVAVELARDRGGTAIVGSIFDHVPGAGTWRTALLLDGNIGIGGAPERLLTRIRSLLGPAGEVIVELDPPGTGTESLLARIETRAEVSASFRWARVAFGDIEAIAAAAGYALLDCAHHGTRWFARLGRERVRPGSQPTRRSARRFPREFEQRSARDKQRYCEQRQQT